MSVSIVKSYELLDKYSRRFNYTTVFILLLIMIAVNFLVMDTGGIKYIFSHLMYLPIVLFALVFGTRGGVPAAIAGGMLLGPTVPIDTMTGEVQETINWVYRMGFFLLIGTTVGLASDAIRAYIRDLRWDSRHDSASELANRYALEEDINALQKKSHKRNFKHCLAIICLSNSKEIDNNFGVNALDIIIIQAAKRIQTVAPASSMVYRTGIDQLCLLMYENTTLGIDKLCKQLRQYFQEPFQFNTLSLHGDIQIGVVKFEKIIQPPVYYLQKASAAAQQAQLSNVPYVIRELDHKSDINITENIELLGSLKEALDTQQLRLYYQPKVNLSTGTIMHAEALMRWQHPLLGYIPPAKFIPRAERSTLIDKLTEFAIDNALGQMLSWKQDGIDIKVAVNISVQNLTQPRFVFQVMSLLEKHGLNGSHLELELTENSLMFNMELAVQVLSRLTRLGIVVSIDDFGTGYSSLQYLQKLPISIIKIDQSFVLNLPREDGSKYIVDAAINLAHKLGMQVVAEGVEDAESLQILRDMGCDFAQGYFISRPVPTDEFSRWYHACQGIYQIDSEHETVKT
jgi:diguanylate cyclase (GGDEF)-like protein